MGFGIYRQQQRYLDAIAQRNAQADTVHSFDYQRVANFYENDRNKFIWWSVGALLFSTFDAFVDAHLRGFDVAPAIGPEGAPGAALRFYW